MGYLGTETGNVVLYLRISAFATQGSIMATSVWPDFRHGNPQDPLEPIRGRYGGRVETAESES